MTTSARTSGSASRTTRSSSSTSVATARTRSRAGNRPCLANRATIQLTSDHHRRVRCTARRGHRTPDEAAFLAFGPGAQQWLITAAAAGTPRMRTKMIAAVALAKIYGQARSIARLATAAELGRFADEDLGQLMRYQAAARPGRSSGGDEARTLKRAPRAWTGFGA